MGTALITVKIMPESPDTDLEKLQKKAEEIIAHHEGENPKIEKEPVAFGLIALNISFSRNEDLDNDEMMNALQSIDHISSAEITDFRRAFG
jgi:elongation factor 1-beta